MHNLWVFFTSHLCLNIFSQYHWHFTWTHVMVTKQYSIFVKHCSKGVWIASCLETFFELWTTKNVLRSLLLSFLISNQKIFSQLKFKINDAHSKHFPEAKSIFNFKFLYHEMLLNHFVKIPTISSPYYTFTCFPLVGFLPSKSTTLAIITRASACHILSAILFSIYKL